MERRDQVRQENDQGAMEDQHVENGDEIEQIVDRIFAETNSDARSSSSARSKMAAARPRTPLVKPGDDLEVDRRRTRRLVASCKGNVCYMSFVVKHHDSFEETCDFFTCSLVLLCHFCTCVHFRRPFGLEPNGVFTPVTTSGCTDQHTPHSTHIGSGAGYCSFR